MTEYRVLGINWDAPEGLRKRLQDVMEQWGWENGEGEPDVPAEPPGAAYRPSPSGGSGGELSDAKNVEFAAGWRTTSIYHRKASHLKGPGPFPLVVHLHGDGYEEVTNYGRGNTASVSYAYEKVAVEAGALFVVPRTPDISTKTWYSKQSSTDWLAAFLEALQASYNIDRRMVFFSGYSGGAEELSYNIIPDHHGLFEGGGAMMLGGGGASGLQGFTGTPPQSLKNDFLLRWWAGEQDNGRPPSDTSINALKASSDGEAWYAGKGFDTARTVVSSLNHYTSERFGPEYLRDLIGESNTRYSIG